MGSSGKDRTFWVPPIYYYFHPERACPPPPFLAKTERINFNSIVVFGKSQFIFGFLIFLLYYISVLSFLCLYVLKLSYAGIQQEILNFMFIFSFKIIIIIRGLGSGTHAYMFQILIPSWASFYHDHLTHG